MHIFAIDLGNKRVKMKSERAEYSYPASYLTTKFLSEDSLSAHQEVEANHIYKLEDNLNMSFIWGGALEIYNVSENMIDTYARSKRMKQKKAQRLLEFALGRLALDFKEECSEDSPLTVHVILGAPIIDMHANSDALDTLTNLVVGQHHLQINGEDVWIDIPSKDFVSVVPQYMGTVLHSAFNQDLNPIPAYVEGKLGIVDIGGGTVLVNSSNALNLSPTGTDKFYGIQTLVKDISSVINSTKPFLIESLLREGNASQGYFYKTNHNKKDVQNITDIVVSAIDEYTRFTIAPLITESFPDLADFDFILVTGGGAAIISKSALLDELGEDYFERLVFVSEPELSNVRGFYKGARLKWVNDEVGVEEEADAVESSEVDIKVNAVEFSEVDTEVNAIESIEDNTEVNAITSSESDIEEKNPILDQWGSSSVEFVPDTGLLTVYCGEISLEWPSSIKRSNIKEIRFMENVRFPSVSTSLLGGNVYNALDNAMVSLVRITGMENVSTTNVTDMSFLFNGCEALEDINLLNFDTSRVTNFSNMFANCRSITHLSLDSFDTSSVENFDSMFLNCEKLNNLDLSAFNMQSARTKVDVFEGCKALSNLTLPIQEV